MNVSVDQLISEIAFLKERVETLEKTAFSAPGTYVEGWAEAARLLGISDQTAVNRHRAGAFPEPCGELEYARGGKTYAIPRWRRADLVNYAENRQAA